MLNVFFFFFCYVKVEIEVKKLECLMFFIFAMYFIPWFLCCTSTRTLCKLWILGASFLPGTWHPLYGTCALNRQHDCEYRSSENNGIKTRSTLSGHPEVNQALPAFGKHKACKPHPSRVMRVLIVNSIRWGV